MLRERNGLDVISEFMRYLARHDVPEAQGLPALTELSRELGVSVASLREQLEVARALGLVDVRPRVGMRRLPYSFRPAVRQSLTYALTLDESQFQKYADLRNHLEFAYWEEAVNKLTGEDKLELKDLISRAREKLNRRSVQVPHEEHRNLHLLIYRRLDNPFVMGVLEAYWDAYEAVGLNMFTGSLEYLQEVWDFHELMVESICNGNYQAGREALVKHIDLIYHRPG